VSDKDRFKISRRQLVIGGTGVTGLATLGTLIGRSQWGADGRFVVAINQMPPGIDYSTIDFGINAAKPMLENINEALVAKNAAGDRVPGLAEWSYSPDGKMVEFRLRRDVHFHDGSPFTAEDVKFSHERLFKHGTFYRSRMRDFERVEIVDDHTVRFYFSSLANAFVRVRSLYIFSKRYHDKVGEERFSSAPVGTGPYRLVDYRPFEHADLDAFEGYWGGAPQVKRVRLAFVQEDMTRVAMLRSGEADMIMAAPFPMVPSLEEAGFVRAQADMHPTFSLRFQLANKSTPWADRRVRLALAHAIDAESIRNGLFGGIPKRYAGFAPGEPGYNPDIKPFSYDPDLSRRLLAEAGYANGFTLPVTYWTNSYYGIRETTEAVALYLKAIGVSCEISAIEATQGLEFVRSISKNPNVRMSMVSPAIFASYGDPVEAMRQAYSGLTPYSWYNDDTFDDAVRGALAAKDDADQAHYLKLAARRLHEDVPTIPLWNNVAVYMMRRGVEYRPMGRDIPSLSLENIDLVAT